MNQTCGPALLRECLDRLGWNPERLAREINKTARHHEVSPKTPYHWLNGAAPRGVIPEVTALTLSLALGEHIDPARLWPALRPDRLAVSAHAGLDQAWTADGALQSAQVISRPTGQLLLPVPGRLAVVPVVDWFTAPVTAPPASSAGEPVSERVLAVLTERVGQLRHLDDAQSGPMLLDWIMQDLRWAAGLACTGSYDPSAGIILFRILAELSQLAGWVATDLARRALGQRLLLAALHFAHAAGDTELAAAIVSCLSYLALWMNAPGDAIRLIRMARQRAAGQASAVTRALLASREARAHAACGNTGACAQAIDQAASLYQNQAGSPVPAPPWTYWISEAVLVGDAGRAWLEAGFPAQAEPLLTAGLALFAGTQPRNRLLHGISLAQCRLSAGELDGAVSAADSALELIAGPGDSARARSRLTELRAGLAAAGSVQATRAASRITDLISA